MLLPENTDDNSGVSEVIGFVLVLGLLVLALAVFQVTAVPIWNENVELNHNTQVQNEMQEIRNAVLTTANSGGSATGSVKLGTDYPNRVVLRNPPASTGRLETTEVRTVTVENATIGGNADLFWDSRGGEIRLDTRRIRYTPSYNEYQNAPTTFYENSVVYNDQDGGTAPITEQSVVDGDRINLVSVNGSLSETGSERANFDSSPLSAPSNRISMTDEGSGGNVTLELPTDLSASDWERLLEEEMVGEGGNVVNVSKPSDTVRIELAESNYTLRTAGVGVGSDKSEPGPAYITEVSGDGESVPEGGTVTLVAEVRDRYSNPVPGETVVVSEDSGNRILGDTKTTDPEGRVRFRYDTTGLSGNVDVKLEMQGGSADYENVTLGFEVFSSSTSTDGDGAYSTYWVTDPPGSQGVVDLTMETAPVADGARVEYSVNDTSLATVSPETGFTSTGGMNTTTLKARGNGTVKVYTSSGGSGDVVNVTMDVSQLPPFFEGLTATVSIQEQQDRIRNAEFDYTLNSVGTVDFSIVGVGSETETGETGTVTVDPAGQENLPVTLEGDINGGECLRIEVPSGSNDGEVFDLVNDGIEC